jgi:DNA-binding response OmpR family regulator
MARLLVVEDDPDVRDLISMRLVMVGHRVIAMPDADLALDSVEQFGAPDAYVLDVGLPGMDGFDLLTRLRENRMNRVPAIFVSASALDKDIMRGRSLGAAYLTKPFAAHALLDAVDEAVSGRPTPSVTEHAW